MAAATPRLFDPAIGLLDRLRYPWKFSLISFCFALPIALLIHMLFSEIGERIDFAAKEREGVAYLRGLAGVRNSLQRAGLAVDPDSGPRLAVAAGELAAINQRLGPRLGVEPRWQELDWLLATRDRLYAPDQRQAFLAQTTAQVHRLNAGVGNQSNLILDPDLDTYYLMDAVVLKLPEIGDIAAAIGLLAGEGTEEHAGRRARLLVLAGRLNALLEELGTNLEVAFAASHTQATAQVLRPALAALHAAALDAIHPLESLAADTAPLEPERYAATAAILLNSTLALWESTTPQLDRLLVQRIDRFKQKRWIITGFVVAVVLVVVYLFMGFYLAVMRTVSRLEQAARSLEAGEAAPALALSNRDELGQVVHAFNRVAAALIEANHANRLLNERLAEDNRHMAAELDVTRRLQQMILPRAEELRKIRELDIAGFMEPATHVGGDYYDVLAHDGGVKIGIGDVTGHGLESGVLMIMVQTAVRTLLANRETDTVKFFSALNRAIYDNVQRMDSDKNLSLALIEYRDGVLDLSGQHEEMIVVRADGGIERIDTIDLGFPIGLDTDISNFIAKIRVKLAPGDGVVLYTDGITEAADAKHQLYGIERLCAVLSREWSQTAEGIREAVIEDVRNHIGGHTVYDDITLLVIKQNPTDTQDLAPPADPAPETPDPWEEIIRLRRENDDLQGALLTTCEHGDLIEAELAEANHRLQVEITERRRSAEALRVLLETVSQQKSDLEILIQILTEHGDQIDLQWNDKVAEVKHLTGLDPLTRIANRRRLDEYYGQSWQRMRELRGPLAVVLCDIDHFKLFNDHYGHLAGDDCLIRVARALDEAMDWEHGLLARNGGEEFALVLPGLDLAAAAAVAERLRERVAALAIPHRDSVTAPYVTVSIGVASTVPMLSATPDSLFKEADLLLYQAKRDGRNRVVF